MLKTAAERRPFFLGAPELIYPETATNSRSRLPIYDGSLDNILGVIRVRDVVSRLAAHRRPRHAAIPRNRAIGAIRLAGLR